jgi:hypothetical protein
LSRIRDLGDDLQRGNDRGNIERIEVRRKKLIEMAMDGLPPAEVKDEMIANATPVRRACSPSSSCPTPG